MEKTVAEEGFLEEIVGVVVCTSRVVKMKEHPHLENSPYFVLKKELLLNVLSNFEREVPLRDSAF